MTFRFLTTILCGLALVPVAHAQEADTTQATHVLESIVVTADRSENMLAQSTGAVSVIAAGELQRLPGVAGVADALRNVPGFAMLNLDGQGFDPQATVRGFYGGGEAEYVLVLLDGRPLNNMEMGLINWSQIPLVAIQSIEIIRGGASSLYGDAAVGGVMNIVTQGSSENARGARLAVSTGSFRTHQGEASLQSVVAGRPFSAFGSWRRTDGFREHAVRQAGSVGLSMGLLQGEKRRVNLSGIGHWRKFDIPGPLTHAELATSRTQGSPFYRLDNTDESTLRLTLSAEQLSSPRLRVSVSGEWRDADVVRTIPLAAQFATTKERTVDTFRLFASAQVEKEGLIFGTDKVVVGLDASSGSLDNSYYDMVTGTAEDYAAHSGARGALSTQGEAGRRSLGAFLQYDLVPHPRLRMTLGGRYDALSDEYTPSGELMDEATHTALSPKVGLNFAFARSERHVGHLYANYLGLFKAATLDQLFDQRLLPVPFPPYGITISNSGLKPQRGTSFEVGLYHRFEFSSAFATELTLTTYEVQMKDELDFSFDTFSYANIASSAHSGVESSLKAYVGDRVTMHANYTYQRVTYEEGDYTGNFVKGVPRDYLNAGFTAELPLGISLGAVLHQTARMYLDDANTLPLDDYTTVDVVVSYPWRQLTAKVEAMNLLDSQYNTTGFPDPSGAAESGVVFLYPGAGRALRLGLTLAL